MNIQKYLLPASIAATVHVAFFWLLPEEPYTRLIEVPLVKKIAGGDPMVQPPDEPEKPDKPSEEVKPLLGAPAPFALDEPPVRPIDTAFPLPVENSHPELRVSVGPVPPVMGVPDGVKDGKFTPETSIWIVGALDNTPRAKVQMPPDYPYAMKQTGTSGSVLVEFDVDKTGRVTRAEAINYTDREFVEPALKAVRKWRFEPGRKDGRTVPFRMSIPIVFGIETGS
jgi:protein TonB